MDHTGPDGKGARTGRGLGSCVKQAGLTDDSKDFQIGKGMGVRRKSGGGTGKGKRIKYRG